MFKPVLTWAMSYSYRHVLIGMYGVAPGTSTATAKKQRYYVRISSILFNLKWVTK
jgi:hypothetical protein